MKKILIIVVFISSAQAQAQTFQEWFNQKQTQIKYLVSQIAALGVYTTTLEKGYSIAREGLTAIGNIKKGDFSLHSEYFNSLGSVNSQIKSYWKIADIIQTQIEIIKAYKKQNKLLNGSGQFNSDEMNYCSSVFTSLLAGCTEIIDQLIALTTDGKLEMKDDERIRRIDELHTGIKDREKFIQSFGSDLSMIAMQRVKDQNDVSTVKSLYGVK